MGIAPCAGEQLSGPENSGPRSCFTPVSARKYGGFLPKRRPFLERNRLQALCEDNKMLYRCCSRISRPEADLLLL